MNFYKYQSSENPIIIERVKEHDSEEMAMDRLERAILTRVMKIVKQHHQSMQYGEKIYVD
ncbi:MAG: hypothetical protein LC127_09295 [Chitinophagales bacterium]|nr:hypothetical protein [Chitinophagales bacterium]